MLREPFVPLLLRKFQRRVEEALHALPAFLAHVVDPRLKRFTLEA